MNWDRVEGDWKQIKGKVQQQWGKLTDDDLDVIEGKRTELAGRLQERYGYAKDEAEKQIGCSARKGRAVQPTARLLFLCALRSKNRAWLITAETIAGWYGLVIRKAGSGRTPVKNRSG